MVWNVRRLIDAANVLGLPVIGTEQYPKGLGRTVPELADRLGTLPSKLSFSAGGCPDLFEELQARGVRKVLVCGIETHVCIQQTVLDLLADGWSVFVAIDAVGSRFEIDHRDCARPDGLGRSNVDHAPKRQCSSGARPPVRPSSSRSASWPANSWDKGRKGYRDLGIWGLRDLGTMRLP